MRSRRRTSGMTLAELLMVMLVLVIIAGLALPTVDDLAVNGHTPQRIATETTMARIRTAILGDGQHPGAWVDLGMRPEFFPPSLNVLRFETPFHAGIPAFDPVTKFGWRGPYLSPDSAVVDGWGNPIELQWDFDHNGIADDDELRYARLVSPGENGVLEVELEDGAIPGEGTGPDLLTRAESGDDVVLFLRTPDRRSPENEDE